MSMESEHDWEWNGEPTKLIGGFGCRLTIPEANAWHEFLDTLPAYAAIRQAEIDESVYYAQIAANVAGAEEKFRQARQDLLTQRRALYDAGKQWYAALLERRKEERAKKQQAS